MHQITTAEKVAEESPDMRSITPLASVRPAWPALDVETGGATHPGLRRRNEDHFLIADLDGQQRVRASNLESSSRRQSELLLVVADGMGGHQAGSTASALAVETLVDSLAAPSRRRENPGATLTRAFERCERAVTTRASEDARYEGMGTTLTAACIVGSMLYVGHVGDSRAYLLREGRLLRLTTDHTLARQLEELGLDGERSAVGHVLTQAIGGGDSGVETEIVDRLLRDGDSVLLVSDGLTRGLDDRVIEDVVKNAASAQAACDALLERGLAADGSDNITAVLARFSARPH